MKKHMYAAGAFTLALAMSGLPALALAQSNGGEGDGNVQATAAAQTTGAAGELSREQQKQASEVSREQQKQQLEASSSNEQAKAEEATSGDQNIEQSQEEINLELEDGSNPASSLDDLNQKIEIRKNQLAQEAASTTPADQNIVENANPVRLAVHALLASKNLIGGIGPQVSEIAKQVNDSVASTTNAEAQIQSRGFFTKLLFGGDSAAADVISQEVAQNQQRIDDLNKLLDQANVPADIQAVLKAQIAALEDAQTRLQDLAQSEQKMWGLFSWRF